ncbi:lysylphosphatidylglycerol synthase transmembrane domain-containing protein [Miniimonas sp. S16]|uniref:lysylphosphatidylglycerol synthase transmembrane domain-containing protein n=1 Tax=Miniimonas sp. S16 TaxID=2171623 RepID=UPI000D528C34|nr:lysylphosphatidylglycerol synthase transmembrane domain-containing protein [Miniimonas sp. S16]
MPEDSYRAVTRRAWWQETSALVTFAVIAGVGLLLASVARRTTQAIDEDLRALLDGVPHTVIEIALLSLQTAFLVGLVATPVALLVLRRPGLVVRGAVAAVVANAAFLGVSRLDFEHADGSSLAPVATVSHVPSSLLIASVAALTATLRPVARGAWQRILWSALVALALLRTLSAPDAPLDVVLAIGVGGLVGTLVLLAMGRSVRELTPSGLAAALAAVDLPVTDVEPLGHNDEWGVPVRSARTGHGILVRVVDDRAWRTDTLDRAFRRIRLRDTGDETAHASPSRAVSAEAMVAMLAADRGVHVPAVLAVATAPLGEAILAVERLDATPLDEVPADALTHDVLASAWHEVRRLHEVRIAHRDLTVRHLVLDGDGQVWITNLTRGEAGVADAPLAGDDAELLASTYALVGAERAVAPALEVLGTDRLVAAVERIVPAALTPRTRAAVKKVPDALAPLVAEAARAAGVEVPTPVAVERFKPRTLVMALALAVAIYVLAPQLANVSTMVSSVQDADWTWIGPLLLASAATYVGAALGLAGGTPGRVPVGEAAAVALAGSFVATFSPPGVSTVALNVRFLQKRGYPTPVAVSASAAKEAAVGIAHIALLVVFAFWAGSTGVLADELDKLPPAHVLILIGVGVLALAGGAFTIPKIRELLRKTVVPAVREAAEAMRPVVSSPAKLAELLGGVVLLPLGYGVALWFALQAFDHSASFVATVLVSLTAGAVANAAPTPGGIGAVEAVLTAALTAIGIPSATAFAAVLLYRLATFWVPILPGFVAFRTLTAKDVL